MKQSMLETIVGFCVIILSIVFLFYAYFINRNQKSDDSYIVKAKFQNVEGIIKGSNVMIAGIKVGIVDNLNLNDQDYSVDSEIKIFNSIKIPIDSNASIVSSGLLGNKYIAINPGLSTDNLKQYDSIQKTQSSINLESLIGKFMYSTDKK
jgi:phospholipid/cholesterol/gamma-HCH transport system substrate-binding protein